jgi:hypothetical protein
MSHRRLLLLAVSAFAMRASAANDAMTVACGNLAPPTL